MPEVQLRGGHTAEDRRLDRLPSFDERSRSFPIREVIPTDLRSVAWRCDPRLDQGQEGACVGYGWSHELAAVPAVVTGVTNQFAREHVYWEAQKIDEWDGGAYPGASPQYEGTSVLAGAKVVQGLGLMDEYRWAFGLDEAMRAISHAGPIVVGTYWLDSMFDPRPSGLLEVDTGSGIAGGHCYMVRGLRLSGYLKGEGYLKQPLIRMRNSWGVGWGLDGDAFMKASDFSTLLSMEGEVCVPVGRQKGTATA